MKIEKWKIIQCCDIKYFVSNLGNVKGNRGIISKSISKGYYYASLRINGESKHKLVSRLVAESFIPNPENKEQVNHKNGIKIDNRVENLEWTTRSENLIHAHLIGLKCKPVYQYSKNGVYLNSFNSPIVASRLTGISNAGISLCALGKTKSSCGYIWSYKKSDDHLFDEITQYKNDILEHLGVGHNADFPLTQLKSMSTTRHRIQKESKKRFSIKQIIIVTRKPDAL